MLVTWKGIFLVKHSLYNLRFCSLLTRTHSYRFFVKLSSLVKSISFSRIVCSLVLIFFSQQMILFSNVPKTKIQFLFRLALNALKRLWCNVDIQVLWAFSSIKANLLSKKFCFSIIAFFLCCRKIFSITAIFVLVHQRKIRIKLLEYEFVCRLQRVFYW